MSEARDTKAVLASVFNRRGANGKYTRLFDHLDPDQQGFLLNNVSLGEDELPIIGSMDAHDRWLILTTKKLVWRLGETTTTLSNDEIVDAIADLRKLQATGRTKLEMSELQIKTTDGVFEIELEPGAPLSGVWSVLKNIGARNRGRRER